MKKSGLRQNFSQTELTSFAIFGLSRAPKRNPGLVGGEGSPRQTPRKCQWTRIYDHLLHRPLTSTSTGIEDWEIILMTVPSEKSRGLQHSAIVKIRRNVFVYSKGLS